jgi:Carboxypeptidase regulatory-like domain
MLVALAIIAGISGASEKKKLPDYALIFGTVFDAQQHPVPGVKIKIRRADQKKAKWELISDRRGEFAQRLPAGTADYVIRPELKDKQAAEKAEVKVHIEKDERQDIAVHLIEQEHTKK